LDLTLTRNRGEEAADSSATHRNPRFFSLAQLSLSRISESKGLNEALRPQLLT
jgi:hypothetical protein